jgi:hypothetical protein
MTSVKRPKATCARSLYAETVHMCTPAHADSLTHAMIGQCASQHAVAVAAKAHQNSLDGWPICTQRALRKRGEHTWRCPKTWPSWWGSLRPTRACQQISVQHTTFRLSPGRGAGCSQPISARLLDPRQLQPLQKHQRRCRGHAHDHHRASIHQPFWVVSAPALTQVDGVPQKRSEDLKTEVHSSVNIKRQAYEIVFADYCHCYLPALLVYRVWVRTQAA